MLVIYFPTTVLMINCAAVAVVLYEFIMRQNQQMRKRADEKKKRAHPP
jgi:hypothetical protein